MNARTIAAACAEALPEDIVIATVDSNVTLTGVLTIPRTDLTERARSLDGEGWTLVFSPGTSRADVEERCIGLARSAFRRWEALRRLDSKHS